MFVYLPWGAQLLPQLALHIFLATVDITTLLAGMSHAESPTSCGKTLVSFKLGQQNDCSYYSPTTKAPCYQPPFDGALSSLQAPQATASMVWDAVDVSDSAYADLAVQVSDWLQANRVAVHTTWSYYMLWQAAALPLPACECLCQFSAGSQRRLPKHPGALAQIQTVDLFGEQPLEATAQTACQVMQWKMYTLDESVFPKVSTCVREWRPAGS